LKARWFIVVVAGTVTLAWCSTPQPPHDIGPGDTVVDAPVDLGHDTTVDGAQIEPLCTRVCNHFFSVGCVWPECAAACRRNFVMAGDGCAALYQAYLTCAEAAPVYCSPAAMIYVTGCTAPHEAAAACMGGPPDGGL
jgi:hypothetical protein